MKKSAIIITLFIVLSLSGYLYFDKYYKNQKLSGWDFITEQTALVIELQNQKDLSGYIKSSRNSLLAKSINFTEVFSAALADSDSIINTSEGNFSLFICLQKTANDKFDATYVVDVSEDIISSRYISDLITIPSSSRVYLDEKIQRIETDSIRIDYFIKDNFLIFSCNPLLIEDVIRARSDNKLKLFKDLNPKIIEVPKLINDDGNLYLNLSKFQDLIKVFTTSSNNNELSKLGDNSFYDFDINGKGLVASGFTFSSDKGFLNTFKDQMPQNDPFDYFIPTNASLASKYIINNANDWHEKLNSYWSRENKAYLLERNDFNKKFDIRPNEYFSLIKNGLANVEVIDGPKSENLLYISVKDRNEFITKMNSFSENVATAQGDSVYFENFGDYILTEVRVKDFPKFIFGPQFDGFESSYYFALNDFVVFGSSISVIKSLIQSIENEQTWGRQISYGKFLNNGLQEHNYSLTVDIQRYWPVLMNYLNPKWKKTIGDQEGDIKKFRLVAIQYSRIDESFYTNLMLEKRDASITGSTSARFEVTQNLAFVNPIISEPEVVKNHNSNLLETLVQDSAYNLSLISDDGNKLWSIKLDDKITCSIAQIDFYKNKKLQYFFTTSNQIYLVDRLGNMVEDYPRKVEFEIKGARVVDYNNTKDYRFLLQSNTGGIYLFDKHGHNLDGWNPLKVTGEHSFVPFHLRIRGKDFFVSLLKNGTLSLYNRRGQVMKGFPLELKERFDSEVFVEEGSDISTTKIHLVSKTGKLFKISLTGLVISKEELFKQTKEARFKIVPDALTKTFLISRNEEHRLVLLNDKLEEIFSKDYLGSEELLVQYYYFTPEQIIYVITDVEQGFTYLYRSNGELINSQPINSSNRIGLLYSESSNEFTVYSVTESTYRQLKFK